MRPRLVLGKMAVPVFLAFLLPTEASAFEIRTHRLISEMAFNLSSTRRFLEDELDPAFAGAPLHGDYCAGPASQYFNLRKLSIYGGSNEIQKNIIAKMILDL